MARHFRNAIYAHSRSDARRRPRRYRFRPLRSEPLEDRRLLTITVDTLVDESDGSIVDGDVSLRDAIALAPSGETIDFAVNGTIELTLGELLIDKGLTIEGPGAELLTIDASGNDPTPGVNNADGTRVFNIDDGNGAADVTVSISGLTLTGGDVGGNGGAILTTEGLMLSGTSILDNAAEIDGGGIHATSAVGGATTITASTITGNTAGARGGGAYMNTSILGTTTITASAIIGNLLSDDNVTRRGGGIHLRTQAAAIATISFSTISDNSIPGSEALSYGGGIFLDANGGTIDFASITISGNAGRSSGGGVYVFIPTGINSIVSISGTTISGNSTVSKNGAGIGAQLLGGTVSIDSSTISGNIGDGLELAGGDGTAISLFHSTVTANTRTGLVVSSLDTVLTLVANIIAENDIRDADLHLGSGAVVSTAYNLVGFGQGLSEFNNTDQINVADAGLGPLADNGGPTQTHALLPGSPAIDAGDPSFTTPPDFDQRGVNYERVQGAAIDIGAYELLLADGNLDGVVGGLDYLIWASNFGDYPADDPPGTPQNGDYNNDGIVSGLDYLLWASQFGAGSAVVASVPAAQTFDNVTSTPSSEELIAVDAALEDDYDTGATVADEPAVRQWQLSRAYDSVLKKTRGRRNGRA